MVTQCNYCTAVCDMGRSKCLQDCFAGFDTLV